MSIRRFISTALATFCALAGGLLLSSVTAQAAVVRDEIGAFGPGGPGVGVFSDPQGVAVSEVPGQEAAVYVYDAGSAGGSIYKFNPAGEPVDFSALGTNAIEHIGEVGAGEGEIAVDSSSGPDSGDIYFASGESGADNVLIYNAAGEPAGEISEAAGVPWGEPCGVAVDSAGNVYVGLYSEHVDKYTPTSGTLTDADYSSSLSGLKEVCNIAADSAGNIYAANYAVGGVTKYEASQFNTMGVPEIGTAFAPGGETLAVDPSSGGDVYVDGKSEIAEYTSSGTLVGSFGTLSESYGVVETHSSGDVYAADGEASEVVIYGPAVKTSLPVVKTEGVSDLQSTSVTLKGTVNPEGADEATTCQFEYGTGESYGQTAPCAESVPSGSTPVAVSAQVSGLTEGTTYHYRLSATNTGGTGYGKDAEFETPGLTIVGQSSEVTGRSSATIKAQIEAKPSGTETHYHFEYGTSSSYGASTPIPEGIVSTKGGRVSASLTRLSSGTTYHFRVVAVNADFPNGVYGADQTFTTEPPLPPALALIEGESALDVTDTTAKLHVQINPHNSDTHLYIQYGTSSCAAGPAACADAPAPPGINLGSGENEQSESIELEGLAPSTTYHYRVVASNAFGTVYSHEPEHTFTTQPPGASLQLPDGRAWELVSPPDKHGALIRGLYDGVGGLVQASADGSAITYLASLPTESEPAGYSNTPSGVQVLSRRGQAGWTSVDIASSHESDTTQEETPEYQFFSTDLSLALANPISDDPMLLSARASAQTPYIRDQALCEQVATASECYLPLFTAKEGYADVEPGAKFGLEYESDGSVNSKNALKFEGATPDLSHVVVRSNVALKAMPMEHEEFYEWSAGRPTDEAVQLVSRLPASEGGGPVASSESKIALGDNFDGGYQGARDAIADEGSRIFWQTFGPSEKAGRGQEQRLYMRDAVKEETIRLDVQQPGVPSGETPASFFQIASSDGSRVFFRDRQRLTANAGHYGEGQEEGGDLYECEIVKEVVEGAFRDKCDLADLTPEHEGQSANVRNDVVGASEDGSYVYFVANGVLAPGATRGSCGAEKALASATCNLYVAHEENGRWTTTFIATLSLEDENDWGGEDSVFHSLGRLTARVSPNGRYLAFMSSRSLTGYDNTDAHSGKPDAEVYLYDAQAQPDVSPLICASCNPTGARPVGVEAGQMNAAGHTNLADVANGNGLNGYISGSWLAANLPAGTVIGEGGASLYQSRLLSDSGRLFFNSSDALVPQDVDGTEDVYEYEPPGVGSCTTSSATYGESSGGCVGLISSGTSPVESGFLDASENGEDVFFLTAEKLVPQDTDTAFDVYDAHVCTTQEPCVSAPVSPPECTTAEGCRAAPAPQPSIFGAPPSATFSGSGNTSLTPKQVVTPKKSAAQIKAEKLAKALEACKKKPKKQRARCEQQAHKRYGTKAKKKSKAKAKKSTSRGKRS